MSPLVEFRKIISELVIHLPRAADVFLELYDCAVKNEHAGVFVDAYFKLLEEAADRQEASQGMNDLRFWLEKNLELSVFDDTRSSLLESFHFELGSHQDLEGFCHKAMRDLWHDRCYESERLRIFFTFAQETAVAV